MRTVGLTMLYMALVFLVVMCNMSQSLRVSRHRSTAAIVIRSANLRAATTRLYGKIAKTEEEKGYTIIADGNENDSEASLPYAGLIGYEANNLFYQPIDISDPLKDTNDLPGEDGSDEKIAAIQQRIQTRVDALKREGTWENEADQYGKDPLSTQPIWVTMMMQLKACRPFETWDELALTYCLVLLTTVVLSAYIVAASDVSKSLLDWYVRTDFNAELFSNVVADLRSQFSSVLDVAASALPVMSGVRP